MASTTTRIHGEMFTIVDTGFQSISHAVYLAHSAHYCLTDDKSDWDDPVQLASTAGIVIYTHDAVLDETVRYGASTGIGCVFTYKDTDDKWWVIAEHNDAFELVTTFGIHNDITQFFTMKIVDDI